MEPVISQSLSLLATSSPHSTCHSLSNQPAPLHNNVHYHKHPRDNQPHSNQQCIQHDTQVESVGFSAPFENLMDDMVGPLTSHCHSDIEMTPPTGGANGGEAQFATASPQHYQPGSGTGAGVVESGPISTKNETNDESKYDKVATGDCAGSQLSMLLCYQNRHPHATKNAEGQNTGHNGIDLNMNDSNTYYLATGNTNAVINQQTHQEPGAYFSNSLSCRTTAAETYCSKDSQPAEQEYASPGSTSLSSSCSSSGVGAEGGGTTTCNNTIGGYEMGSSPPCLQSNRHTHKNWIGNFQDSQEYSSYEDDHTGLQAHAEFNESSNLQQGHSVEAYKPKEAIRKRRKTLTPNEVKDPLYWEKRRKNNESARKSRENKKEKEKMFYERAITLEEENQCLRDKIEQLETKLNQLSNHNAFF